MLNALSRIYRRLVPVRAPEPTAVVVPLMETHRVQYAIHTMPVEFIEYIMHEAATRTEPSHTCEHEVLREYARTEARTICRIGLVRVRYSLTGLYFMGGSLCIDIKIEACAPNKRLDLTEELESSDYEYKDTRVVVLTMRKERPVRFNWFDPRGIDHEASDLSETACRDWLCIYLRNKDRPGHGDYIKQHATPEDIEAACRELRCRGIAVVTPLDTEPDVVIGDYLPEVLK